MNLKEAFRVQNLYRQWLHDAKYIMSNSANQYSSTQTYYYGRVEPTQTDEVTCP